MREDELDLALETLRGRLSVQEVPPELRTRECVPLTRLRLCALNPENGTPAEQCHFAECHRCARLLASARRQMPHLPIGVIIRGRLSLLTAAEQSLRSIHLTQGGCALCGQREATLGMLRLPVIRLAGPGPLPSASGVGAAEDESAAGGTSGELEAELVVADDAVTLDIRTRDAETAARPVAYSVIGAGGSHDGLAWLRLDVEGWHTAQLRWEARAAAALPEGGIRGVVISGVPLEALTEEERHVEPGSRGV